MTSDGAKINYLRRGSGETIVLLHGWSMSTLYWRRQLIPLSKNFNVIAIDLRGHGMSATTDDNDASIDRLAADVVELMRHLNVDRFHAIGWSMGASVLLALHDRLGASSFSTVTLVEQPPKLLNGDGWFGGLSDLTVQKVESQVAAIRTDRDAVIEAFVPTMFELPLTPSALEQFVKDAKRPNVGFAASLFKDLSLGSWLHVLPTIESPTLLIAGASSIARIGVEHMQSRIAGSELIIFENSRHCPFWEEADHFNWRVLDFIQRQTG